ncbi:hypothetical protein HWC80_gp035 [Mycobacterium phage Indlulamithi]|uniref:Uncharacterized protein n=1 Tax=Mycobacterium phage Indlulamithi TaxID=2656582 RepID=A0A649VCP1_9CAUD|nr:hypothetical protein HWC80_gp035 [Mycobacterium phage Indlulamithi]QGJ90076.1 hypothetical protein PBI_INDLULAMITHI_35 [Mycobacterium phage Indlulamithi]
MASPEQEIQGKLDGRDPNTPNYLALPYRGVSLYRSVELGQSTVVRPAGADPGKKPGELWWTTSTLDEVTVMAEILTNKYHGQTIWNMITGLFAVVVEGKSPEDVRKALSL